ncbi:MAG: CDGSH iron-sulfur domain-containing protein [Verrucomicrobiaceae bacterium]
MNDLKVREIVIPAGTHWMCTCGKSVNYPYCDGTHKKTGGAPRKLVLEAPIPVPARPPSDDL